MRSATPSRLLRTAYRFVPLGLSYQETIKVEVNLDEGEALYDLVSVDVRTLSDEDEVFSVAARSYDLNEMLATKTRALLQREQVRDLFDLHHAWQLSERGATRRPIGSTARKRWKPSCGT